MLFLVLLHKSSGKPRLASPASEDVKGQAYLGCGFPSRDARPQGRFRGAVKKSGLKDFRFHDLRHTFATRLVQHSVDLYTVQKLMGHKSVRTNERYAHHYPESLRPSVRARYECYREDFCHVLVTV